MPTRRDVLAGLAGLAAASVAGCSSHRAAMPPASGYPASSVPASVPAPAAQGGLDAVIDMSHWTTVRDFTAARTNSRILGVIHKASEGLDWRDPLYDERRAEAESANLLWGAYHFGTRQHSGAEQANAFLSAARPGPTILLALDLELNQGNPANSMRLDQAEEFVRTLLAATGQFPVVYTSAGWADGRTGRGRLGGVVSDRSILAQCPLWLADYRPQPQLPGAWTRRGWTMWQYTGDADRAGVYAAQSASVAGIDRCGRNLFSGDAGALRRFWSGAPGGGTRVVS